MEEETIFHKIVKGEAPCYTVWEDERHLAFLSIFPNTPGVTVVIPKEFQPSYFVETEESAFVDLIQATRKVAAKIDKAFDSVGRTAMVFEGTGVNYLHAKLFPMHGTADNTWQEMHSEIDTFSEHYDGHISSHDCHSHGMTDQDFKALAEKISNA